MAIVRSTWSQSSSGTRDIIQYMAGCMAVAALVLVACDKPPAAPGRTSSALDNREQQLVRYIDAEREAAIEFLERTVNVNSGSLNLEGVRAVAELYHERFAAMGFAVRWVSMDEVDRAGHLVAERRGPPGHGKRVLLIGHLDTVFEADSEFQRYERVSPTVARGPGVLDMKGGNAVIVYALEALHSIGSLDKATITVVLTGDEESTGKPLKVSRKTLIDAAKASDIALGFEGGIGGPNTVTVARRGFTSWRLKVSGKGGHSSGIFSDHAGAGALYESARILSAFYDQLRGRENITANAALAIGGTSVKHQPDEFSGQAFGKNNVIPQEVIVTGDLRTLDETQRQWAKDAMRAIVTADHLPHTSATIAFRDSYPPMAPTPGNRALATILDKVGGDLGLGPIEVIAPGRRGAADISFAAPHVEGALAGLGVTGSGSHSVEETIDLPSLAIASKRAAVFLHRLIQPE